MAPTSSAISIHALLAESDEFNAALESANSDFNPRSPCGERRSTRRIWRMLTPISIHALLAESDAMFASMLEAEMLFQSTLSLRRATKICPCRWCTDEISIHALLAESDTWHGILFCYASNFNPRSPCGERPALAMYWASKSGYFNPRSPCGERRWHRPRTGPAVQFQSTLSLRRATFFPAEVFIPHRFQSTLSLRRATTRPTFPRLPRWHFNPRSPCGERRSVGFPNAALRSISIHALLAESDPPWRYIGPTNPDISIHALLAESDRTGSGTPLR